MLVRQIATAFLFGVLSAAVEARAGEIGATRVATWHDDKRAPIVLMFDDGMPSHVKTVLPELQKRGLVGTFYVNPGAGHFKALAESWRKDFLASGMTLANHTYTHKGATDIANCEEEITQANEVIREIYAAAGQAPTLLSFGKPGVPQGKWNVGDDDLLKLLTKHGLVRRPGVLFAQIHLKDGPAMIARVQKALDSGKPDAVAFHGVGGEWLSIDVPAFQTLLDFIVANRSRLWVTDPVSIHKYETERDGAEIDNVTVNDREIRFRLRTTAVARTYDAPLTLVTRVPAEWTGVRVTQGKQSATVAAADGTVKYDVRPGDDAIVLTPAP
jgi:peptidoglycan/xylan/chitin deacetylase (PgdA/CDA1 family)